MSIATLKRYVPSPTEDCHIIRNNVHSDEEFQVAMDTIVDKHTRLYEFGLAMSGVQFIGLSVDTLANTDQLKQVGYFLLAICCLVSLFGSTASYILIKYITSIRWEHKEFVLAGIYKNRAWFRFTEIIPYLTSGLFLTTINLMTHTLVPLVFACVFNVMSGVFFLTIFVMLYGLICKNQSYLPIDPDEDILLRKI